MLFGTSVAHIKPHLNLEAAMKTVTPPLALCFSLFSIAASGAVPAATDSASTSSTQIIRHESTDEFGDDKDFRQTEIRKLEVGSGGGAPTQQAGQSPPTTGAQDKYEQTVITEKRPSEGGLRNEAVGIKPQFGILSMDDADDEGHARGVAGVTVDINGLRRLDDSSGRPFLGPSVGVLYSHLGTSTADFFGTNSDDGRESGTHLLLIPFNLKAGYTFRDIFRPSIHAGATLIYNNERDQPTGIEPADSSTNVRANIGLDFEFGIGKSVALLIRPDWVFAPRSSIFTGTLGLVFPLS
jgi:hypothetical protein